MKTKLCRNTLYGLVLASTSLIANATQFVDPFVFTSDRNTKTLDLLMVAKPGPINALPGVNGWVYNICERKYSIGDQCQKDKTNPNPYGGSRLQINQGDTLKIHLINELPLAPEAIHQFDPGEQFLIQNPTNIHTHGMLVTPTSLLPNTPNTKYGDNIFVLTFNINNGQPIITPNTHVHGDVNMDSTDYQITVPAHHPSGLFWFHPHAHGISMNQISAGLSGALTVGQLTDYVTGLPASTKVNNLILKDIQVNGDNTINDQEDPGFCTSLATQPGFCNGANNGKWYFTLSGQLNPSINVNATGQV
ncbi:hypothetical protein [Methylobacter sp. S3L5C]|uniref:hypothetical protein n=1 Tax=Methylobacter sp. S3L5C TaxID=2839024 RepID=UPI001FAE1F0B|nr:hypothetical protein [Methylobacter sp. S3L5C]UOA07319.1 hypothetical protein KKZ03_13610 [Methylobacter sp. S3L5C]